MLTQQILVLGTSSIAGTVIGVKLTKNKLEQRLYTHEVHIENQWIKT